MSPEPTGRVELTPTGKDLILTRVLPIPVAETWGWITESQRLGKWFGTWTGEARPGGTVQVTMNAEEGDPVSDAEVVSCDSGRSYAVKVTDEHGGWHLELVVEADGDGSRLIFIHHLDPATEVGTVGAGWEYYLDRMTAAMNETPMPEFDDYWPAMGPYYEDR